MTTNPPAVTRTPRQIHRKNGTVETEQVYRMAGDVIRRSFRIYVAARLFRSDEQGWIVASLHASRARAAKEHSAYNTTRAVVVEILETEAN